MKATMTGNYSSSRFTKPASIIVIDDDELTRQSCQLIAKCLSRKVRVITFSHPDAAIREITETNTKSNADETKFDDTKLILLDLILPTKLGIRDTIRELKLVSKAPIVIYSGWLGLPWIADQVGADDYFQKGQSGEKLLDFMEKYLIG